MTSAEIVFWFLIALVFYTYIGYGTLIAILAFIRQKINPDKPFNPDFCPAATLIIAAYNEEHWIREKVNNTLGLDYPKDKLQVIFVTDGSDDATPQILREFEEILVLHKPGRAGKIAAMERAIAYADNPILIFTDANTVLNKEAIKNIVRHYNDPGIGAVAGEKRIMVADSDSASGSGEGFYWKYESFLKKMDFRFYTVVGAAGELFSVRKDLYRPSEPDTILDDFMISLRVCQQGFRVAYEPDACASELPSANIEAEWTCKTRIAAGGIQSIVRLKSLLNPFRNPRLAFQYVSHRVLRWTLVPIAFLLAPIINIFLLSLGSLYIGLIILQGFIFILALGGHFLKNRKIKLKLFFIPYYIIMMNAAVVAGFFRYIGGRQSVLWKKAERAR